MGQDRMGQDRMGQDGMGQDRLDQIRLDRQIDKQTNRQIDGQVDRQTDRQVDIHVYVTTHHPCMVVCVYAWTLWQSGGGDKLSIYVYMYTRHCTLTDTFSYQLFNVDIVYIFTIDYNLSAH